MATSRSYLHNDDDDDVPPVPSRQSRSSGHYNRSASASDVMMASQQNNNNKPPKPVVPRNSLIRSSSAQLYHHRQQTTSQQQVIATTNKQETTTTTTATTLSRSFTFETSSGVRRKIPVTPVLSTGPKHAGGSNSHDTAHYRHGTLVFPTTTNVIAGKLTLDLTGSAPPVAILPMPTTTTTPPTATIPSIIGNPFFAGSQTIDQSLLKLCQEGDAGALSRYLSYHHDKVPPRTLNATDPSGKSGLVQAAMTGNLAVARQLVKLSGLEINLPDNEGNTALHLAAQAGHADIVSLLTLCPNLVIDMRNHAGLTALMKAALQGRVRCTRLLLLAGASPVLRDFGRGLCAAEWARLTARAKCAEIIDKYMEKMQLNPGLGLKSLSVGTSEPSLADKRSSLVLLAPAKAKDSWVKSTIKKAIRIVSNRGSEPSTTSNNFNIASQLTGTGVLGASVLLPGDPARRSSLPVLFPDDTSGRSNRSSTTSSSSSNFVVPRIQVSYWTCSGGSIPPPPSTSPKSIPAEMRPQTTSRQRSRSSTRS